ncbi:gentisate 1,2-dioxygenase [Caballeronia arationis]|jgi:gentisate 1,2-dioxygenase|uniref:Gentisate 1,2-dioxygenase n=1 Tax=Caballeronia arationis TaxID=1777142 RepID=A0A7Z7IE85_9BURK|nr:cupin domain-containing protein [Caballeronia arationis]SAK65735.1 gentisate 1,2-dioxygenase [Caballeronia arationis]SOE89163.1 gentisate 1,2-dioxygenase [Caballeronia arationis]
MSEAVMSDTVQRQALAEELDSFNCRVAQPTDGPLFTRTPQSAMKAAHWKASDLERLLEKIGAKLKLEAGGQRRTLRLANRGLPFGTTPTIWASIQYILPGEIATAHRHTASALRFIMKGHGADTIVDGERYEMNEGDLVLTPAWTWHDHEHKGDEPMIWLDVLDISLVRSMHATFFEGSEKPRQAVSEIPDRSYRRYGSGLMRPLNDASTPALNPLLVYSAERSQEALRLAAELPPDPFDDTALEYLNPLTGDSALPTIGTVLQSLRPGMHTKAHRHTGSVVYYVMRGKGATIVDGTTFEWGPGDFMAIPPWALHEHINRSDDTPAMLFQVNDFPALKKLGLYREEAV